MRLPTAVAAAFLAAGFCLLSGGAASADKTIDNCRYTRDSAAQAAWQPMRGSPPALAAKAGGQRALRLRCNFAGTVIERASWDRKVKLDLTPYQGVELRLFARNLAPVGHFAIYFQSGAGWYSASFYPESSTGWNTIVIPKARMRTEGAPAGWNRIETVRVSAWRGRGEDTEFFLGGLRGYGVLGADAFVAILRADSAREESRAAAEFAATVAGTLDAAGIRHATLSDLDLTGGQLRLAKILVLPDNPSLPDRAASEIVRYLNGGGKLLAFYSVPAKLRAAVPVEPGPHIKASFAAMRFTPGALPGAPATVEQRSWNISAAKPVAGKSRVVAEWLDETGRPTGHAAVIASRNAILMTHVLLKDDAANKRRMLMAMTGYLAPELLRPAVATSIERIGCVGGAKDFSGAVTMISRAGKGDRAVRAALDAAKRARAEARSLFSARKYAEAAEKAGAANERLVEAFARAQRPQPGEFRAFWCHRASGVEGMNWDQAIRRLAENGFTAIIPNMLWGGAAFYPGKVLPVAAEVAEKGDQVAQCLAACRKYGLAMHVWKVNWNLGRYAPAAFVEKMRREGRLQVNSRGRQEQWLCPSNPANQKLEIDSMVELARNYAVDGIHFDYIRYPDGDHCFCDGCRARFARAAGVTIRQWPRDVLADGPYRRQWLDWRRGNITAVVRTVSEQARQVRPKIRISAAVFRNWAVDRDGVGQDWKLWCERGYLDFVCPMDYTGSDAQFDSWIASQKEWAGKVPVYPGIGASSSSSVLGPDRVIGQIRIARRHHTNGFVIFNYGVREAAELVPVLGMGITRR